MDAQLRIDLIFLGGDTFLPLDYPQTHVQHLWNMKYILLKKKCMKRNQGRDTLPTAICSCSEWNCHGGELPGTGLESFCTASPSLPYQLGLGVGTLAVGTLKVSIRLNTQSKKHCKASLKAF